MANGKTFEFRKTTLLCVEHPGVNRVCTCLIVDLADESLCQAIRSLQLWVGSTDVLNQLIWRVRSDQQE